VLFESVMSALAELTPSQRLMFLLRHYEGMSYDEIASAMGCSSGTVKKGVSRAISKLRARLIRDNDEPESLTRLAAEC
jgi:RNA polymerase sigma factor (sigma-70 family)